MCGTQPVYSLPVPSLVKLRTVRQLSPHWDGSEAQKLLKKDVADGKHEGMKPLDYYNSRPQYNTWGFSAATIAGHVKQEVRLLKFNEQYRGRYGYGGDD